MQKGYYPFFTFSDTRLEDIVTPEISIIDAPISSYRTNSFIENINDCWSEDDGFVVLDCVTNNEDPPTDDLFN